MSDIRPSRTMQAATVLIAGVAWLALLLQLYLMVFTGQPGVAAVLERRLNTFSFFTVLTNFVAAVGLLAMGLRRWMDRRAVVRYEQQRFPVSSIVR